VSDLSISYEGEAREAFAARWERWSTHGRFRRDWLRRRFLLIADTLAVLTAGLVMWAWHRDGKAALDVAAFLPGWLLGAKVAGLYDRDHRSLRWLTIDDAPRLLALAFVGTTLIGSTLYLVGSSPLERNERFVLGPLLFALMFIARVAARVIFRYTVAPERAVIVGTGPLAAFTLRRLQLSKDLHLSVDHAIEAEDLEQLFADGQLAHVERVIVADSVADGNRLARLVAYARSRQIKVSVVPPLEARYGTAVQLTHVDDLPVVEYHTWDVSRTTRAFKRLGDIAVSILLLVVLAPLLLVIGLVLKFSDGGPILFVQERAGFGGRPFRMLKFRTMVPDAPQLLEELLDLGALHRPMFKLRDDPRITRVGAVLRRHSLDELPQLVNILRGEMSLVGPRPEQVELVERYQPEERFRLNVKPGLTGPMQIAGRGELDFDERLSLERDYVENLSLANDLRILARTVGAVVGRHGAF
jgi:exopolysaccharide biosynthesis polyprenyl glycosylphosphotransferase